MTQDEIIEMARQAGFMMENSAAIQAAETFADLVAAKKQKKWQEVEIHEALVELMEFRQWGAQPEQVIQDRTCSITLRLQGKPYPRTCKKCGMGPCIAQPTAQPEQEPVAWRTFDGEGGYDYCSYEDNESYADDWNKRNPNHKGWVDKLYTHPQRTWVGLTDEEMEATFIECGGKWNGDFWKIEDADFHPFLRTIEAKLKEKNT